MFSFIAWESPTDSSKRCYYDDVLASYSIWLVRCYRSSQNQPIKRKRKYVWDYCKIIYSACISLVLDLYYWVWLLTPGSLIKNIMLGIGLSVQLLLMFYFLFKRINEEPDERFYRNIAKSSSILFTIAIFILLGIVTLIAVCKVFVLNADFFIFWWLFTLIICHYLLYH